MQVGVTGVVLLVLWAAMFLLDNILFVACMLICKVLLFYGLVLGFSLKGCLFDCEVCVWVCKWFWGLPWVLCFDL